MPPRERGSAMRWLRRLRSVAMCLVLAMPTGGCVKVYQPVSGLNRPVVLDLGVANFQDLELTIHCPPGELIDPEEARDLCRKVGVLFENQGARVTTSSSAGRFGDEALDHSLEDQPAAAPVQPTTGLILELQAHQVHEKNHHLTWLMCAATFSIVPAVAEFTFAQEVTVRDNTGFLLVSDTLEGRIVRYGGAGYWLSNKALDLWSRDKTDRIIADGRPHADVSADFYAQLSQLVFNAKMRWRVLDQANPAGGE
jgi:hypothetical protein